MATAEIEFNLRQPGALDQRSLQHLALKRFMRNKIALSGVVLMGLLVLTVLVGPMLIDRGLAMRPQPLQMLQHPSREHILGTDEVGRDVFARLVYAGRISISVGFFSMTISTLIGTLTGVIAGYHGGIVDQVLMRLTDAMLSVPSIFLLLMIGAVVRPNVPIIILVLGLLNWVDIARVLRGHVLTIRKMNYIEAARGLGASNGMIMSHHIIPNSMGTILVAAPLIVARAILSESALSFLGLGIQPPTPSWGNMLNQAQQHLLNTPGLAVSPGIMIMITVVSVNLIGDGLRDALDPRLINK
jgi:peptide/nickel transport system permease protein